MSKDKLNFEVPEVCFEIDERLGKFYHSSQPENPELLDEQNADDRYNIQSQIAEGGLKSIFKAFDHKSNRHVAMAFLKDGDNDSSRVKSFVREAKITALLEHPNIIPVYDVNEEEKPFFTMKLVHGENLSHYLFESKEYFSRNQLLRIFVSVCDAIAYAHSRGVVHLDLKPDNIRIDNYSEVLVHDWGVSKRIFIPDEDSNDLSADGSNIPEYVEGTPSYMAPEQFKPDKNLLDERTDIFSLGGILYSILTGKPPFDSKDFGQRESQFTDIQNFSSIPESLRAVTAKALALEPDERYQGAIELRNDIERYLDGFATEAESASFIKQLNLLIQRNKLICLTVSVATFLIIILTVLFIKKLQASERQTLIALNSAEKAKSVAENALNESRKNFDLFLKEKEDKEEISEDTSSSFALLDITPNRVNYTIAMNQLETALSVSPGNEALHKKKLLLHLLHEEFQEAIDEFPLTGKPEFIASAIAVLPKYVNLKNKENRLSDYHFIELIGDLSEAKSNWIANLLCMAKVKFTKSKVRHLKQLEDVFKVTNKAQKDWDFSYETTDGVIFSSFTLKGSENVYSFAALCGRYISTLDLSHSNTLYSSNLSLVYVKKLIAYNVEIKHVRKLAKIRGLEELVVKKGQLSDEQKNILKFLKVTELK